MAKQEAPIVLEDETLVKYAGVFDRFVQSEESLPSAWLCPLRRQAFNRFEKAGFPTLRDDHWRYSNLEPVKKVDADALPAAQTALSLKEIQPFLFSAHWPRVVFLNGAYQPALSTGGAGQLGLQAVSLAEAVGSRDKRLEMFLNRARSGEARALNDLNTAFFREGVLLEIEPGARLESPVHILSWFSSDEKAFSVHPRILVASGSCSKGTLVQSFVSSGKQSFFNNTLTQVALGENAALDHYVYAPRNTAGFHVVRSEADLAAGSRYRSFVFSAESLFFRNETAVNLNAPCAEAFLQGLFLTKAREHLDLEALVCHQAPRGLSRQLFRGIAQGSSRIAVNGKVYVHPGAQKTDAEQSLKNLLLSPDAVVDARPQFEIFADDVKCSHGAAIGQLDEDLVFYLQSRGIGDAEARKILTRGFAFEVLETFEQSELRSSVENELVNYFES